MAVIVAAPSAPNFEVAIGVNIRKKTAGPITERFIYLSLPVIISRFPADPVAKFTSWPINNISKRRLLSEKPSPNNPIKKLEELYNKTTRGNPLTNINRTDQIDMPFNFTTSPEALYCESFAGIITLMAVNKKLQTRANL